MEKRFQVFVSSTYADLKEERRRVIQALMEMDCIPSGMELFPAADEEQWEFIRKIIDDCDYYLLIIGGRYGTTTAEGVSYTEKEYDYALQQGLKVVALLHENPDDIPVGKSDIDPVLRERLRRFREKVAANRLVKFWRRAEELPGLVALSLSKTIKTYPAVGWVRADKMPSVDMLAEINELRKENDRLKKEMSQLNNSSPVIANLADLDEIIEISGEGYDTVGSNRRNISVRKSWREIFALISPYLLQNPIDSSVRGSLERSLWPKLYSASINNQDYQTIKIQMMALKIVNIKYTKTTKGGMALFWSLTQKGNSLMMDLRTVKSQLHELMGES